MSVMTSTTARSLHRKLLLLGFVGLWLSSVVSCGGDGGSDRVPDASDDATVEDDATTDAPSEVTDSTPVTDLSGAEIGAICAPFKVLRDALLEEESKLQSIYCIASQFTSPGGGEPPAPPETEGECEASETACLADLDGVPPSAAAIVVLNCDEPGGLVERLLAYEGAGTVSDLKECLGHQLEERERVIGLQCSDFIDDAAIASFAASAACSALGLTS